MTAISNGQTINIKGHEFVIAQVQKIDPIADRSKIEAGLVAKVLVRKPQEKKLYRANLYPGDGQFIATIKAA